MYKQRQEGKRSRVCEYGWVLTADECAGTGRVDALDESLVLKNAPCHGADPAENGGSQADAVFTLCVGFCVCGWGDKVYMHIENICK